MPNGEADFSRPGNDGGFLPKDDEITISVDLGVSVPDWESHRVCNQRYLIACERREKLSAATRIAQKRRLYAEARRFARARRAGLPCSPGCDQRREWLESYAWGVIPDAIAYARVTIGLVCLAQAAVGPDGVSEPEDADFILDAGAQAEPPTKDTLSPEVLIATGPLKRLPCPGETAHRLAAVYLVSRPGGCRGLDFKPYVDDAVSHATFWEFNAGSCRKGCDHHLEILRREWNCTDVVDSLCLVRVVLYLRIVCA
jgi:hypothetical protein